MKAVQEKTYQVAGKRLAGKVVVITGGSRGIGAGIALRLAEEGANVAITYNSKAQQANEVVEKIRKLEVQAAAFHASVTSPEQTKKMIEDVIKEFGKIDILINNAGVFEMTPLEKMTIEDFDRVFDVNVKGVIRTTTAALSKISEGGRIINITSVASKVTMAGFSIYSASKAALDTLTRIWAQELGARKITVNAVAPGTTASDMLHEAMDAAGIDEMAKKTALGRVGEPDDIAAVVAFLASDDGKWITGQTITADGGLIV